SSDGAYRGTMRVKIGPVTAEYAGTARLEEIDEDAHVASFRVQGSGGAGTAAATIVCHVEPAEDGASRVVVETDLRVTGRAASFDYAAPATLDDALALLGDDAKPLAGGQSLVPLLNFRLARPRLVVDVNGVPGLSTIRHAEGTLRIGALVRQSALERSSLVA